MDKPKKGNTITIKINGKDRPVKNKKQEPVEQIKEQKQASAFEQIKEMKQPTLHENVEQETAAAKETAPDSEYFEWILPSDHEKEFQTIKEIDHDSSEKKDKPRKNPFINKQGKKVNPEKRKWLTTIFLIVLFAVILGTIFGLTMLNMVLPDDGATSRSQPVIENKVQDVPADAGGNVEFKLQPITTYVVQEGIYSSKETAQQKQEELKQAGMPAQVIDMSGMGMSGKLAIFISVSNTLDGAKTAGNEFGARGMEIFAKEFMIDGKTVKGIGTEESKLLELAPQMYQTLAENMTVKKISNQISADGKKVFEQQDTSLSAMDKEKLKNQQIKQLYAELKEASAQLKTYDKNADPGSGSLVQQHLLTFLAIYQGL